MKGVKVCEKLGVVDKQALIPRSLNQLKFNADNQLELNLK
jgi:hypothetical protein